MGLAAAPPAPMEAKLVSALPEDGGWQFEPKWDGFRALARRQGDAVEIWSKSGKPLGRFFPEVVALLARLGTADFLLDGELILPVGDSLSFDALQARLGAYKGQPVTLGTLTLEGRPHAA